MGVTPSSYKQKLVTAEESGPDSKLPKIAEADGGIVILGMSYEGLPFQEML